MPRKHCLLPKLLHSPPETPTWILLLYVGYRAKIAFQGAKVPTAMKAGRAAGDAAFSLCARFSALGEVVLVT